MPRCRSRSGSGPRGGAATIGQNPAAAIPSSVANMDRSPPLSVAYSQRRSTLGIAITLGRAGLNMQ
jgi:hypothetical protein